MPSRAEEGTDKTVLLRGMIRRALLVLLLAPAWLGADAAAQQPAHPVPTVKTDALTPSEAQHLIDVLEDPKKRDELIATLRALGRVAPPPSGAPAQTAQEGTALQPGSLGAQLLSQMSGWPARLAEGAAGAVKTLTDFPFLWGWGRRIIVDPARRGIVLDAAWQLALVLVAALLLEAFSRTAVRRPIAGLAAHAPRPDSGRTEHSSEAPGWSHRNGAWHLLRRLPFALARLLLELVPVGVFWGAGSLLAGVVPDPLTRFAIIIAVDAYASGLTIVAFGAMLLSPSQPRLRLLQISDRQAEYLARWVWWIIAVAVLGSAAASLAQLFGLYQAAYETLLRLVGLIVAVLLGILVLRCRHGVARRIRAVSHDDGEAGRWRVWLAGAWHYLALLAIVAGWILWAAGMRQGLGGLRLLIGTVAIVVTARLIAIVGLGMLDHATRPSREESLAPARAIARAARYHAVARLIVMAVIVTGTALALLQFWGADVFVWFAAGQVGARLVSALVTIAIAAIAAIVVWEGANAALEHRLARLSEAGPPAHSARLRTLLPMLRAALLATILAIVGLTALSQVGVNIAPLLAGAGIVGVAIGFGAQKLVQDVITGLFVLLENAIQIGDTVTVAGLSGSVEQLSVRNIWLRGADGAVHIVPFSAVTSITNSNRGLGNAAVSVTIAFKEDADRVQQVLLDIGTELRGDPNYAPSILGELQAWVDAVKSEGVTIAGKIPCTDTGRAAVQHEFNRRLQKRFQELGIELGTA